MSKSLGERTLTIAGPGASIVQMQASFQPEVPPPPRGEGLGWSGARTSLGGVPGMGFGTFAESFWEIPSDGLILGFLRPELGLFDFGF